MSRYGFRSYACAFVAFLTVIPLASWVFPRSSHTSRRLQPGQQLWVSRYGVSLGDYATAISTSPDGTKVLVTGEAGSAGAYTTLAYDAQTGAQVWLSTYKGPGGAGDVPHAITVSPTGSTLVVTGESSGLNGNQYDYATVAYDPQSGM